MITGTTVEIIHMDGLADYVPNKVLSQVMADSFKEVGLPEYTEDEKKLAKAYARTIPREDMANAKADISKKTGH